MRVGEEIQVAGIVHAFDSGQHLTRRVGQRLGIHPGCGQRVQHAVDALRVVAGRTPAAEGAQ